jgi:signal transduction histidine kinase
MSREIIKMVIIGAGKGGTLLIPIIHNLEVSKVVLVVDKRKNAPGLQVAEKLGIPISINANDAFEIEADFIINTTGVKQYDQVIIQKIALSKAKKKAQPMTGLSAKLVWNLIEQKQAVIDQRKVVKDIYDVGVELVASNDIKEDGKLIVEKALAISRTKKGKLLYFDEQNKEMHLVYAKGFRVKSLKKRKWNIDSQSIANMIIDDKKPLIVNNVNEYKIPRGKVIKQEKIKAFIAMPLLAGKKLVGILFLNDTKTRTFDEALINNLSLITTQAAFALNKDILLERLRKSEKHLKAINSISEVTSQSLKIDEITQEGLEKVLEVVDLELGVVRFREDDNLTIRASQGVSEEYIRKNETITIKEVGMNSELFKKGKVIPVEDAKKAFEDGKIGRTFIFDTGVKSYLKVPIKSGVKVLGIMNVGSRKETKFKEEDITLLESIGNVMGVALENAQFHEKTQKSLDAEREKLQKAELLMVVEKFTADLKHDLKTPLTGILGSSSYLHSTGYGKDNNRLWNHIEIIRDYARVANDLVDYLLMPASHSMFKKEKFNLSELINESLYLIQMDIGTKESKINVNKDYLRNNFEFFADKEKLKWAIINILSNACKAMKDGGILSINTKKNNKSIKIIISDTGEGIPKEKFDEIFELFSSKSSGGFGLYFARESVQRHGGIITVKSEVGEGSTFTIDLPTEEVLK